jgi:hypothetical protein
MHCLSCYLNGIFSQLLEVSGELLEVFIGDLQLGKHFASLEFIHFVGKVVSSCVGLDG